MVAGSEFPGHYVGEDHSWNLETFKEDLKVDLQRLTPSEVEFDLVGVDASIANSLRRILISEVPTVAIERVYSYQNTSIIQDEVLAHRLGLVPINIDPRKMKMLTFAPDGQMEATDENTLVFQLAVTCRRNPDPTISRDETDPTKLYINSHVYSGHLEWKPEGTQYKKFNVKEPVDSEHRSKTKGKGKGKGKGKADMEAMDVDDSEEGQDLNADGLPYDPAPAPVYDDILLAKLRPGQELSLLLYCQKGIGKDHAKFSPVATASYRLLPHIQILAQPAPHLARKFQACFPPGVIELEYDEATGENTKVVVANPRLDTVSREVLRHDEFKDIVRLNRIRDHFIYTIQSTGAYKPEELLPEAIGVMQNKISSVEACLRALYPSHAPGYKQTD